MTSTSEATVEAQAQRLEALVHSISRMLRAGILKHSGGSMTLIQFRALTHLDSQPRGLGDLADNLQVRLYTASTHVDGLEQAGWACRCQDPSDGRRLLITITESGRILRKKIEEGLSLELVHRLNILNPKQSGDFEAGVSLLERLFVLESTEAEHTPSDASE